ncbi:MAG: hypothetical protein WCF19_00040 [Chlamydiales bacterium]
MLEFFRIYQRYFFLVISVVLVCSLLFFGTYSTFGGGEERPDLTIGQKIDGSSMTLFEVQKLSRFIAADREDVPESRGALPNLCNDGVIRYDFLKDGLASLIVGPYFDALKGELEDRLERIKRFKPYVHPEASFLSAKTIWNQFVPEINREIGGLQGESAASLSVFSRLERLYQLQGRLQPETLRQILIYQHRQYPWLTVDQRLSYEDLSLFGFHSASDWFGRRFIDLISEFILNAAAAAEGKGYRVSLQEAKGDLIHHFQESIQKLTDAKANPEISFHSHLRTLGFDEKSASEVWRKVLLFRRYFQDVGAAAFVDRLPYKDFAEYAKEAAVVQTYRWPIVLRNHQDLAEFRFYVKAISPKGTTLLPTAILPVEEVEKKVPQLVSRTYRGAVAEVSKKELALRATLKQIWDWETDESHWPLLKNQFSLPTAQDVNERFKILEQLEATKRTEIDAWVREKLVDENPIWLEEALASAPKNEKTWTVSGAETPYDSPYIRVEHQELVQEKHILPFNEAREALAKLVPKTAEEEYDPRKSPFALIGKEALAALEQDRGDLRWVQSGADPLLDQFKLERTEQTILRTSKEDWMKEQVFLLSVGLWSPIHVAENGEVAFFYVQEKKTNPVPILDQLAFGKETLAADAKAYVAEKLLHAIKKKQAIVIPIQKEDE